MTHSCRRRRSDLLLWAALLSSAGCSGVVANVAADVLAGDGSAFSAEDDPELVREAIPFGLKTIDSLLASSPANRKLLLAACSGYAQYAYAFLLQDADRLADSDPARARSLAARAKKLLRRARDYGLRGLESVSGGFLEELARDRRKAVQRFDDARDVPLLYWTAASWALTINLSKDDMAAVGRLPDVEALMGRALELDESWDAGAIHEFYVTYDGGRSPAIGGSVERARRHLERALALSGGRKIGPYVAWAETVCVQQQDRKCFDENLGRALAFDADTAPQFRLVNLIGQERARMLEARAGDLFVEE